MRAPDGANGRCGAPSAEARQALYEQTLAGIGALIATERDEIAVLATVVAELHHGLAHFHWTGFYRVVAPGLLKIGPYQGTQGCLSIPFERGVCGAAARSGRTQRVDDVHRVPDHIACSASTRSEIVVPVFDRGGSVRAVLDVDSDFPTAFDDTDQQGLERLCASLQAVYD